MGSFRRMGLGCCRGQSWKNVVFQPWHSCKVVGGIGLLEEVPTETGEGTDEVPVERVHRKV